MGTAVTRGASSSGSDALRSSAESGRYLPSTLFWLAAHASSPRSAESLND